MSDQTNLPTQAVSQRVITQSRSFSNLFAKCGGRGQLSNSTGTLYTAPSNTTPTGSTQGALLDQIILCNTDGSDRTATIYLVESGGSAAANRAIMSAATVKAGQTLILDFSPDGCPLDSGETVQGVASAAAKITYRLSVRERT